jgi:hypothetical protein
VQPFVPGSPPECSRSLLNYPHDIQRVIHARSFTDVSCSGADTSDFTAPQYPLVPPQLDAVTHSTRLVTMTIGGNDENVFVNSFFGCATVSAQSITGNPCQQKFGDLFVNQIRYQTYPHVVAALEAVRQKAPHATVVILGYPTILPPTGQLACYPAMPISMGDVPYLYHEQQVLNGVIKLAAQRTGARFVDMAPSSVGHDACQPPWRRWIEPASNPVNAAPVHPNFVGEAAMAAQTLAQVRLLHPAER